MTQMSRSLKHTDEAKLKISAAHSKKIERSDGVVFNSATEAGKFLGKQHSKISLAATGHRKSAYGFTWKYI